MPSAGSTLGAGGRSRIRSMPFLKRRDESRVFGGCKPHLQYLEYPGHVAVRHGNRIEPQAGEHDAVQVSR